jgi:hypothetical protein
MSQATTWGMMTTGPADAAAVASRINVSLSALLSAHSGTTAPAYAVDGTLWLDTSVSNTYRLRLRRGTNWDIFWQYDPATGLGNNPQNDVNYGKRTENRWHTLQYTVTVAAAAVIDFSLPTNYDHFRVLLRGTQTTPPGVTGPRMYMSNTNGSTFFSGASDYYVGGYTIAGTGGTAVTGTAGATTSTMSLGYVSIGNQQTYDGFTIDLDIYRGSATRAASYHSKYFFYGNPSIYLGQYAGFRNAAGTMNYCRIHIGDPANGSNLSPGAVLILEGHSNV